MTDPGAGSTGPARPESGAGRGQNEPDIIVRPTVEEVSATAAERIVAGLGAAIDARGRADFATTGGSGPVGIYTVLESSLRDRVDWTRVHFWWGDDRYVPRDHPLSNTQAADAILFDVEESQERALEVPIDHIHPFPCTRAIAHALGAAWCAKEYAEELRTARLPQTRGFPAFDVMLIGVGSDGHVLSVFPGSDAFGSAEWAMAIPAPMQVEPHIERVTLNPAVVETARTVLVVTSGASKAAIVGRIFRTRRDPRTLPAQLARRSSATWIIDAAAAADLPSEITSR